METIDLSLLCIFFFMAAALVALGWYLIKPKDKHSENANQNSPMQATATPRQNSFQGGKTQPIFSLDGVQDLLQVYEDRVEIVPRGLLGLMNKGVRGIKEIPYYSIVAVQFKESGLMSGYLQFTIPGGNENRGGILEAAKDENTFMFVGQENNAKAIEIKQYITSKIKELRTPHAAPVATSLSDEIQKLAILKQQGIISEQEFQAAKEKLVR